MSVVPNIPEIPKRWDQLLFVAGLGLMYFNQGNKACFLLGVLLFGVGIIIAIAPTVAKFAYEKEPPYDEGKSFVLLYLFITGVILLIIMLLCWVLVQL